MDKIRVEMDGRTLEYYHKGLAENRSVTVSYNTRTDEYTANVPALTRLSASEVRCLAELLQEAERILEVLNNA